MAPVAGSLVRPPRQGGGVRASCGDDDVGDHHPVRPGVEEGLLVPFAQRLLVSGEGRQPHVAIESRGAMAGEVLADRGDPRLAKPLAERPPVPSDERRIGTEAAYPDDTLPRIA